VHYKLFLVKKSEKLRKQLNSGFHLKSKNVFNENMDKSSLIYRGEK
jgi:hypothetical protein